MFVELIIGAAVTCEEKSVYIDWIMNMTEENQIVMKGIIQDCLSRLEDLDVDEDEDDGEDLEDEEYDSSQNDLPFDDDVDASMSGLFRDAMSEFNNVTQGMDMDVAFDSIDNFDETNSKSTSRSNVSNRKSSKKMTTAIDANIIQERNDLRKALAQAKRELNSYQTQSQRMVEDTESSQKKLRTLAEDLQERLALRQEELNQVEETLLKTKRALEDMEAKVDDLTERNATLADELDIANAKASQLRKAEATVVAYRKKLEGVGVMNQQMTDLEDQSAKYLGQIMDLEMETKKVPELQKKLEEAKRDLIRVQREKDESAENVEIKVKEISKLKSDLSASNNAKKMFEEELNELRSIQQSDSKDMVEDMDVAGISLTSAKSLTEVREKAMRLEIENKNLRKQLGIDINMAVGGSLVGVNNNMNSSTITALQDEVRDLQAAITKKEASIQKLTTDKDRLEAYTKKTLSKFQEKYLVALQECKAKLKEKHDKIEQLEVRSATEKSNQKREEKLLSSAIYELGLSIMQSKLKER